MKKLFAYALILVMLLSLAACGKNEPETQTQPQTVADTTEATEPVAPETTEQVAAPEKVTVYLLESSVLLDSGKTEYFYDTDYNIISAKVYTVENEIMCTHNYEENDENGMPCVIRTVWPDGGDEQIRNLEYFMDGKLKEERDAGSNFSGFQYDYDEKGDLAEKREYYEGNLKSVTHYGYYGEQLVAVFSEDAEGNRIAGGNIENGRIAIMSYSEHEYGYKYSNRYEYDENGNLVKMTVIIDGETASGEEYSYKAVEVDADRAAYLLEQQKYLISTAY